MIANIAVLVSGGGTNLQALIDAQNSGVLKHGKIKLVVSDKPEVYALTRANEAKIENLVIYKNELGKEEFEFQLQQILVKHNIDFIVLAGFLCILSKNFTDSWQNKIINIHPSLIPAFCGEGFYGLKVHEAALQRGVKLSGATVHFVNDVPDGGPIILQKAIKVKKTDTAEKLQKRIMKEAEWKLLPQAAELISKQIVKEKSSVLKQNN